ncbi:hypothetical protein KXW15_003048, partial [Aspergillus fumigatus]
SPVFLDAERYEDSQNSLVSFRETPASQLPARPVLAPSLLAVDPFMGKTIANVSLLTRKDPIRGHDIWPFPPIRPIEFGRHDGQKTGDSFPGNQHHFRRHATNFTVDPAPPCCDFPL